MKKQEDEKKMHKLKIMNMKDENRMIKTKQEKKDDDDDQDKENEDEDNKK